MTCRLLRAGLGAAFLAALSVPVPVVAKPPDLPDDGAFTLQGLFRGWNLPQVMAASPAEIQPEQRPDYHIISGERPVLSPQPKPDDLLDIPMPQTNNDYQPTGAGISQVGGWGFRNGSWRVPFINYWISRRQPPPPDQNDGYVRPIATGIDFAYQTINDLPAAENEAASPPPVEVLPMPREEADVTCPYLRQQTIDRHASQFADPQIGRDVLDNLARLQEADDLLELAKELADDGYFAEAMECCDLAKALCPSSPSAQRAADTRLELALGLFQPETDTEEATEQEPEASDREPGNEQLVGGLMKACHLLVSQGMHHQAAELARQAFVLDPQRVMADPLIYKMHLLAESPPAGVSEASEPPTCPYCGSSGKPIRAIVVEPKMQEANITTLLVPALPKVDFEVVPALDRVLTESMKPSSSAEEASEDAAPANDEQWLRALIHDSPLAVDADTEGSLRLSGDCTLGGNVYHLRFNHGCLMIWKTPDASK